MICYKDMTFCPFANCKHFGDTKEDPDNCFRSLTKRIRREAKKNNLPICQFTEKPGCYEEKTNLPEMAQNKRR